MATLLYVRTSSGGSGPDVFLQDLGIIVATGAGWTLLSSSAPDRADGSAGQFTAREIRDSVELFAAINGGTLEWSKNGVAVESATSYTSDYMLFQDFTDDSPYFPNVTVSGTLTASGFDVTNHFNGGAGKHDASEIDIEGTYSNIPGSPGDLETVIAGINTQLGGVAAYSFANIQADAGLAVADAAADTLTVIGADGILTGATPGTDTITISGTALLPRDGSRPMTGDLNMAFNDINNVQDLSVSGVATFTHADLLLPVDTAAPVSPLVNGQIVVVDGIAYIYDSTRAKWLSIERKMIWAARNAGAQDIYLRIYDGLATSVTGYRMLRNGTITGIVLQTDGAEAWTLEIRKNDVVTAILSLSSGGAAGNQSTISNVNFSQGDEIQFFCSGGTLLNPITSPVGGIEIAWRI